MRGHEFEYGGWENVIPIHIQRPPLNIISQIAMSFVFAKIAPTLHTFNIVTNIVKLIFGAQGTLISFYISFIHGLQILYNTYV